MKLISKQSFRSVPSANVTDDMIRVTMDMTKNEFYDMKKFLFLAGFHIRNVDQEIQEVKVNLTDEDLDNLGL